MGFLVPTPSLWRIVVNGAAVYTLDEARAFRLNHSIPAIAGNAGAR